MGQQLSTNTFGVAKWVVSADATQGTHTTLSSAYTSASSGDTIFVRDGTYTENPTVKAGVELTALSGEGNTPNVTVIGKFTMTTAGTATICGIRLQTNSDFAVAVTGSAASILNLQDCYLNMTNNTGISYTSSNAASAIYCFNSSGNIGTTGITALSMSSTGTFEFFNCSITNTGASTTASTVSAGLLGCNYSSLAFPITTSGTGALSSVYNMYVNATTNATSLTIGGSGGGTSRYDTFTSGTASAVSVSSTFNMFTANIDSSNTNTVTGAGTITYGDTVYTGTSVGINTTTQNIKPGSSFQKVVVQTFTGSGTYTPTTGMKYAKITCVGNGGGGGGTATGAAATLAIGGGGGGGGTSYKEVTATSVGTSQTVTFGTTGAGGTAGNNAGTSGGDVSVGSLCIGKGGTGGTGNSGSTSPAGGAGGVAGTGDYTVPGQKGGIGCGSSVTAVLGLFGAGGNSLYGFGGAAASSTPATGTAGQNYGAGGAGGASFNANGTAAGGAGTTGIVIIEEYI